MEPKCYDEYLLNKYGDPHFLFPLSVVLGHMLLHAKFFQIIVGSFEYPHFPLTLHVSNFYQFYHKASGCLCYFPEVQVTIGIYKMQCCPLQT